MSTRPQNSAAPRPIVFVCVNGILTAPGDSDGWTDRAVTWLHVHNHGPRVVVAEKWEYATGALTRRLKQQTRAEKIATMLGYYERAGFEIVLIGHSNGCDIIARVLALRNAEAWYFSEPVRSVHLISAAADWIDFEHALDADDVSRVFLYCAGKDAALKAGMISRAMWGWAGLGYGALGLTGAVDSWHSDRIITTREESYGHSTWFEKGERFECTMQLIVAREFIEAPAQLFRPAVSPS